MAKTLEARTFKVLSALLSYPTRALQDAAHDLRAALRADGLLKQSTLAFVSGFIDELEAGDLYDLQERYVETFDRGRSLSLYLFEHVHGESRDRGQAMIDLKALYEKHGLDATSGELPDFLPLFLEFLSTLPLGEAQQLLSQIAHIVEALGERLKKRQAPYAVLFRALADLAAPAVADGPIIVAANLPEEDPADLAALDAQWEDEPVSFGPEAAPNCREQLFARIRAARRPAQDLAPFGGGHG